MQQMLASAAETYFHSGAALPEPSMPAELAPDLWCSARLGPSRHVRPWLVLLTFVAEVSAVQLSTEPQAETNPA